MNQIHNLLYDYELGVAIILQKDYLLVKKRVVVKKSTKEKIGVGIVVGVIVAIVTVILNQVIPELPIVDSLKEPKLKITEFSYRNQPWPGSPFGFDVDVFNEGKTTAENCFVFIDDDRVENSEPLRSRMFSVTPGNTEEKISLVDGVYPNSGKINMQVQVVCSNHSTDVILKTAEVESP